MYHWKHMPKRVIAGALAVTLTVTAFASNGWWSADKYAGVEKDAINESFSAAVDAMLEGQKLIPTGLSFELTTTLKADSTANEYPPGSGQHIENFGYVKAWLSNHRGSAKTVEVPLSSDPNMKVSIDFTKLDNAYLSCIAEHAPTVVAVGPPGTQGVAKYVYFPTESALDYPNFMREAFGDADIGKLKFNLLLMALAHGYKKNTDEEVQDTINGTDYSYLLYAMARAIESNGGFNGTDVDSDWQKMGQWIDQELRLGYNPNKEGSSDVYNSFQEGGNAKAIFKTCWSRAKFLSNFSFTPTSAMLGLTPATVGDDGKYHRTYDYSGLDADSISFFQQVTLKEDVEGITFTNDGGKLDLASDTAEPLADSASQLGSVHLIIPGDVEIAPSCLVAMQGIAFRNAVSPDQAVPSSQVRFAAYQQPMDIAFTPNQTTPPNDSSTPDGEVTEGYFELEMHRYQHDEMFNATYNINLRKFDSETGKPLQGSEWDVLEAFDYDGEVSGTVLEDDNWQNDSGSQFMKWEGWDYGDGNPNGDVANDPCDLDRNVTNENGQLIYMNSNKIAHTDTKTYAYTKGYCGGHPAPEIHPYTYDGDDPDVQAEVDAKNEELEKEAWDAWQKEVDTCEKLSEEGGFFHQDGVTKETAAASEEPMHNMEADRDQHYKDFISLKYQYSAVELDARPGYILHGNHTDDIPIEEKTVTSSELKDLNGNFNGEIPHTESSGGSDEDGEGEMRANVIDTAALSGHRTSASPSHAEETNESDLMTTFMVSDEEAVADENETTEDEETEDEELVEEEASEEEIPDVEITDDGIATDSEADEATPSEADKKTSRLEKMFVSARRFVIDSADKVMSTVEDFAENAKDFMMDVFSDTAHPTRDTTTFEATIANKVDPLETPIIDHTFIAYDHRTEGELHFNKRDLDLNDNKGDSFDDYAQENGDGTLEGAVYGLFAAQDIVHPDGKTGTVYEAGDLVSVATTDRNGDGSFMTFTEAPGMTYNYSTGKIEKRDTGWDGPQNLHTNETDADEREQDNESYIGFDSNNKAQNLTDSEAGGDDHVGDHYHKHSSNQDGLEGIKGSFAVYPIGNNEDNNKNCWIGRPLIAANGGTQYIIKELSRSEGYELSVTGKANDITNGKDSYLDTSDLPEVTISDKVWDKVSNYFYVDVTGKNVTGDIHIKASGLEGNPKFAVSKKTKEKYTTTVTENVPTEVPVIGEKGNYIFLNSGRVEAQKGDTVTVNGKDYTVNEVKKEKAANIGAVPKNYMTYGTPKKTTYGTNNYTAFMNAYNADLKSLGYKEPTAEAPWVRIKLSGGSDTDWITAITKYITDNGLIYFNSMRIKEIRTIGGADYALLTYDQQMGTSNAVNAVYNPDTDVVFVKKDTDKGYHVFVPYEVNGKDVISFNKDTNGFLQNASIKPQSIQTDSVYPNEIEYRLVDEPDKSYWVYDGVQQAFNNDGTLKTEIKSIPHEKEVELEREVESLLDLTFEKNGDDYEFVIPASQFEDGKTIKLKVYGADDSFTARYSQEARFVYVPINTDANSYLEMKTLAYESQDKVSSDAGTVAAPINVLERPIRQKIKVNKDIETLPEAKTVWYCLNCGYENQDGTTNCGHCGRERTTEETKTIKYAHDTYNAVHKENLPADGSGKNGILDWLNNLMGGGVADQSAKDVPEFRFKSYLKSNLERLYRDNDGSIVWVDRNGNEMTPQYEDTNGDGNYDTFTWKYNTAYDGKTVDWPEKDKVSEGKELQSANVQKINTKVEHNEDSLTTSQRANNVWAQYRDPEYADQELAEKDAYTTSERPSETEEGVGGDISGNAVGTNGALYSYNGQNEDVAHSDRINDNQNPDYTRLLEMRKQTVEDGAGNTREVESYNYEKFFDAISAANTDIWDNDMHSTFDGDSMENYPGQHWFETFYEKYQKDDADPDHTLENTDNADADNTAGGDRDTSFKPFRWIREHVFGDRSDYEKYPAEHNGVNTEVGSSTSDYAKANAEASDAVRQFATKWYLQDEAGKLMKNNGVDENIAKNEDGTIKYDEAVYDEALFNAIAKAYNYLKPFYVYDFDTIYSVEWDSAADGGTDSDYTTLSIDIDDGEEFYNTSAYLPYGTYIIVEQQPARRDGSVNDWDNRSYTIEKPKEVILPSVYDAAQVNDTTDNYDTHYNYDKNQDLQEQAKKDNYLIRFGEEWSDQTNSQDEREFVIRAHNYHGDFEVYKYGLDVDRMNSVERDYDGINYDGGAFRYNGWVFDQEPFDPLKDYYMPDHKGEAGLDNIGTENGGNDMADYYGADKTNGKDTANGTQYDSVPLTARYFYGSVSEDAGIADNVMYKGGSTDDNNISGMQWKDKVASMTGELTAYDGKYAQMLVPWSVTDPADIHEYSAENFTGYADTNMRDGFFTTFLKINKVDSETGEYILHDNAIFALYAGSRYQSFEEIEVDAKLIEDPEEREAFLTQFKPGDAKFYLKDTKISGSKEFLMAMGATEITPVELKDVTGVDITDPETQKGNPVYKDLTETEKQDPTMNEIYAKYTGIVKKGTPIAVESERINLTDNLGAKTGQMTVYTTLNDVEMAGEEEPAQKSYGDQNTGYFITPQPIGAGVYVLAEIKAPDGYARSKPIAYEVYSDKTSYYVDGDMYAKVSAVRQQSNLLDDINYDK